MNINEIPERQKELKLKKESHRCTRCGLVGGMAYIDPFLCEDCATEIWEGG